MMLLPIIRYKAGDYSSAFLFANKTWRKVLTTKLGNAIMGISQVNLANFPGGFSMNKEEILQASRNENQNKDIYELEVISKGQRIGGLIGICVAFLLMITERVILDSGTNYGYFLIILSAGAGLWIYKAVRMKKKHEILLAVLWSVLSVYAAVMLAWGYIG